MTDGASRLLPGSRVSVKTAGESVVNVAEVFVRRPVMTGLVMIGILIFGIFSYRLLPVATCRTSTFRRSR